MSQSVNTTTNAFFDNLYKAYGRDVKSLGWSERGQLERFKAVERYLPDRFGSILDVGCGFGDFAYFLRQRRPSQNFQYTGYDINKNFVDSLADFPLGTIELCDFLTAEPQEDAYDVVVSIGSFNVRVDGNDHILEQAIRNATFCAKDMAVISALSCYADRPAQDSNPLSYFYQPENVFAVAKKYASRVDLVHNYLPHDFLICVYK